MEIEAAYWYLITTSWTDLNNSGPETFEYLVCELRSFKQQSATGGATEVAIAARQLGEANFKLSSASELLALRTKTTLQPSCAHAMVTRRHIRIPWLTPYVRHCATPEMA